MILKRKKQIKIKEKKIKAKKINLIIKLILNYMSLNIKKQ